MNRQPRIQQLYRDLAAKMQMVRINGGTAEMFKPNAMSSARPAARAAFARYLRAERAVMLFTFFNTPWPNSPWALPMSLPAPGTSPLDGVYIQLVGRSKRRSPPVHCYLENPLTGQKIEGSEFTIGAGQ